MANITQSVGGRGEIQVLVCEHPTSIHLPTFLAPIITNAAFLKSKVSNPAPSPSDLPFSLTSCSLSSPGALCSDYMELLQIPQAFVLSLATIYWQIFFVLAFLFFLVNSHHCSDLREFFLTLLAFPNSFLPSSICVPSLGA